MSEVQKGEPSLPHVEAYEAQRAASDKHWAEVDARNAQDMEDSHAGQVQSYHERMLDRADQKSGAARLGRRVLEHVRYATVDRGLKRDVDEKFRTSGHGASR